MLLFVIYALSIVSQMQTIFGWWLALVGIASVIVCATSYFTAFDFTYLNKDGVGSEVKTVDGKEVDAFYIRKDGDSFDPIFFSKIYSRFLSTFKYWMIIPLILYGLAPSERTQYIMLGTYVAQATVEKIEGSTIMDKVGKLIEVKIDEIVSKDLEEAAEKKEETKK